MFRLALSNLLKRPLRSALTAAGIGLALAIVLLIDRIGSAYRSHLLKELNSMGLHLMLVPLGCPYDAAARVLNRQILETSLPEEALALCRTESEVAVAAPLLIAAVPRPEQGRTDLFVGLDEHGISLKRWWKASSGVAAFHSPDSIILGADAAQAEMRQPGDLFYSPELKRTFKVAAVLERSGTSDDSLFFVPLRTAQAMFNSPQRITAAAIRLRDPVKLREVSTRLAEIPGVQVVTQTEMMGVFLNILGTVRALLQSIAGVALIGSLAGLMNTVLMSVAERAWEFSLFRAIGASRAQLFTVVSLESLFLTVSGAAAGILACGILQSSALGLASRYLPAGAVGAMDAKTICFAALFGIAAALLVSLLPAWRAMRIDPALALKGGG